MLPEGLSVLEVVRSGPGSLADRIDASVWRIAMPGVAPERSRTAVAALEAAEVVEVERMTKNGLRTLDVRAALVRLTIEEPAGVTDTPGGRHPNDARSGDDAPADGPRRTGDAPGDAPGGATAEVTDLRARAQAAVCGTLSVVVRHTTPAVRPDDVVSALRSVAGLEPPVPVTATRTEQGRLGDSGELLDPLEADRATTGRESVPGRHAGEDRPV